MKPVREFFSEITDIDNRLVRTFIHLFKNPSRVIESSIEGQEDYTKPLRYFLFTSTLFIVWRFVYDNVVESFFVNEVETADWWLPERIAKASSLFNNVSDTIFPFHILFFIVPLAIVLLKVLFLNKTWKEVRNIVLYSFAQFWVLLSLLVPVLVSVDLAELASVLIAFAIVGFCFRALLSKRVWLAMVKWMALTFLITIFFYEVSLPVTQWCLFNIALKGRYQEAENNAIPLEKTAITLEGRIGTTLPVRRDTTHKMITLRRSSGDSVAVQCHQLNKALLWQTMVPRLERLREVLSVTLRNGDQGILVLADQTIVPKICRATLFSSKGKVIYTKTYQEEMVLNGGDFINWNLVLTGGKSNGKGEGVVPFIDVVLLAYAGSEVYTPVDEQTYFLPGVGHRFDDVYALNSSPGQLSLLISKYESAKAMTMPTGAMDLNRILVMNVTLDSAINIVWETEIYLRNSKYSPPKNESMQMRYDADRHEIIAFYSLPDDETTSSHLFRLDTLGNITLKQKINAGDLTFITDVSPANDGLYFCGWTEVGIESPILDPPTRGLMGFVSDGGKISHVNVGKNSQGQFYFLDKIVVGDSLKVAGVHFTHSMLNLNAEWTLFSFDPVVVSPQK